MATPYSEIYSFFTQKITDYSFLNLLESQVEDIEFGYLRSSIPKFKNCKKNLKNRDEENKIFNVDLEDEELDILATLMVVEWITPRINNIELIKQNMSSKDFAMYSQANHLKELKDLKKELKREASQLMVSYSFSPANIENISV